MKQYGKYNESYINIVPIAYAQICI